MYIEREREIVAARPVNKDFGKKRESADYDSYRYVEAPKTVGFVDDGTGPMARSRSITYETNPRYSGRVAERERVVVEAGGRRREYYRKP